MTPRQQISKIDNICMKWSMDNLSTKSALKQIKEVLGK